VLLGEERHAVSGVTFTHASVGDGLCLVLIEAFFTIVAVPTGCVMPAAHTHTAGALTRKLVYVPIKPAFLGMQIAFTRYKM